MKERVAIDRTESSMLYRGYVSGGSRDLEELLGGFADSNDRWRRAVERAPKERDKASRSEMVDAVIQYNRRIGAGKTVLDNLQAWSGGRARIVVTGQQPGPIGGPLMTVYKIATAISVAARLESLYAVPVVPVFWMGADDVDFSEIKDFAVAAGDLALVRAGFARDAHGAAVPVGAIPTDAVAAIWGSVGPILDSLPGFADVDGMVQNVFAESVDHAEVTARVLMWVFGGNMIVVDGREGTVRKCARELILRYFDNEGELRDVVRSRGENLARGGLHAQIWTGPDSGVFLMEDGARKKINAAKRNHARIHFEQHIEDASPGVVLRTLVQDAVFQPVAVVLGAAEIAYRAQIADLYGQLGIHRPIAFPRLSATWAPAQVHALIEAGNLDASLLATDPAAFVATVFDSQSDARAFEAAEKFVASFLSARQQYLSEISEMGVSGGAGKVEKRFADLERRLRQTVDSLSDGGRAKAIAQWPFLAHLADTLSAEGQRQERYLSAATLWLHDPSRAGATIMDVASDHVDAGMDGRIDHIVYSS